MSVSNRGSELYERFGMGLEDGVTEWTFCPVLLDSCFSVSAWRELAGGALFAAEDADEAAVVGRS